MKCVICNGEEVELREVEEEIRNGADVFRTKLTTQVCQNCGERYYNRSTMRRLEKVRDDLKSGKLKLREVGRVLEEV